MDGQHPIVSRPSDPQLAEYSNTASEHVEVPAIVLPALYATLFSAFKARQLYARPSPISTRTTKEKLRDDVEALPSPHPPSRPFTIRTLRLALILYHSQRLVKLTSGFSPSSGDFAFTCVAEAATLLAAGIWVEREALRSSISVALGWSLLLLAEKTNLLSSGLTSLPIAVLALCAARPGGKDNWTVTPLIFSGTLLLAIVLEPFSFIDPSVGVTRWISALCGGQCFRLLLLALMFLLLTLMSPRTLIKELQSTATSPQGQTYGGGITNALFAIGTMAIAFIWTSLAASCLFVSFDLTALKLKGTGDPMHGVAFLAGLVMLLIYCLMSLPELWRATDKRLDEPPLKQTMRVHYWKTFDAVGWTIVVMLATVAILMVLYA